MSLKLITPPSTFPVDLASAKLHLRVDGTDEDTLITSLITAATQMAEQETGRALMTQTWELSLDSFPTAIELTRMPVQSVTSVKYYDTDSVQQTLSSGAYTLSVADDFSFPQIVPVYGTEWPTAQDRLDTVAVRYVAGYADAASVPEAIKQWIKLMIGSMYDNRESEVRANPTKLRFVDRLLDRYRVGTV